MRAKRIRVDGAGHAMGVLCPKEHDGSKRLQRTQAGLFECQGCGAYMNTNEMLDQRDAKKGKSK